MTAVHEQPGQIQAHAPGLFDALLDFKSVAPKLPKDKLARVQTQKGTYEYRYTSLDRIADEIDPLLTERGLLWIAMPVIGPDGADALAYQLAHVPSGQTISGTMKLPGGDFGTAQAYGSGVTYARRYAKVAVLDLVADEDDDGQIAGHRESVASSSTSGIDMRDRAKGLNDAAINVARASVGLPKLEKPWASLVNIPAELSGPFETALHAARTAQG